MINDKPDELFMEKGKPITRVKRTSHVLSLCPDIVLEDKHVYAVRIEEHNGTFELNMIANGTKTLHCERALMTEYPFEEL